MQLDRVRERLFQNVRQRIENGLLERLRRSACRAASPVRVEGLDLPSPTQSQERMLLSWARARLPNSSLEPARLVGQRLGAAFARLRNGAGRSARRYVRAMSTPAAS